MNIKENDVNKGIRIINSYEECLRTEREWDKNDNYKNEDEIKQCEIKINYELMPFNYFYNFKSKGRYTIKYSFKNKLKSTFLMFYGCSSLTNIDLSNFNTNNVNNMGSMFSGCSSLTNIDLSNFNTNNVKDMGSMFSDCSSLTYINLSNFNINNGTYMAGIFFRCSSLTKNNIITKDRKILDALKLK